MSLTCAALWLRFLCQPLRSVFECAYVLCFVLGAPEATYQTTTSTKRDFIHTLYSFLSTQGEWKEAAAGEPPLRTFLMGGREPSNRKVTENLEAFLSTQPTRKTAKMTPNKGENYGASTESSSTQSRVSIRTDYLSVQKIVVNRLVDSPFQRIERICWVPPATNLQKF